MTIGHAVMNEIDCLDDCSLIKDDMYIGIIKLIDLTPYGKHNRKQQKSTFRLHYY